MCTKVKNAFGYDDSLDAFGIHGIGGAWGALLAGVFASSAIGGDAGLLEGNPAIMVPQVMGVLAAAAISVVVTLILLKILDAVMGLRVTEDDEIRGLDISQHGEEGYIFQ